MRRLGYARGRRHPRLPILTGGVPSSLEQGGNGMRILVGTVGQSVLATDDGET